MKVVIDTNIFLVSLRSGGRFRPIFQHLLDSHYHLVITNEILSEYLEIIERKTNAVIANNVGDLLIRLANVERIETYFNWTLITADYDDNKFVDAAVAGNVDFLVSNDNHFKVLQSVEFPKVNVVSPEDFIKLLNEI